jgi:hypothetical protein
METLSLIFSSLKFKKEKVFVGKEQKFMYVPKVSALKPRHDLQVESSSGTSEVPTEVNDASSLDVT